MNIPTHECDECGSEGDFKKYNTYNNLSTGNSNGYEDGDFAAPNRTISAV